MREDGGAAFPGPTQPEWATHESGERYLIGTGMSLRDWFAGRAMQALVHHAFNHIAEESEDGDAMTPEARRVLSDIGEVAYHIADAMLAQRGEKDAGS